MALFSNNISRLFENNPVNQVGPTGQPLLGGSNITDLATRSLGGLLGREVRGRPEQLTAALSQIDPNDPQKMIKMYGLITELGEPPQQMAAMEKMKGMALEQTALRQKKQTLQGSRSITSYINQLTTEELLSKGSRSAISELERTFNLPAGQGASLIKNELEIRKSAKEDQQGTPEQYQVYQLAHSTPEEQAKVPFSVWLDRNEAGPSQTTEYRNYILAVPPLARAELTFQQWIDRNKGNATNTTELERAYNTAKTEGALPTDTDGKVMGIAAFKNQIWSPSQTTNSLTTTQKEYNLAKKEGYAGSFLDYQKNVLGKGPPPPTIEFVEDEDGFKIYASGPNKGKYWDPEAKQRSVTHKNQQRVGDVLFKDSTVEALESSNMDMTATIEGVKAGRIKPEDALKDLNVPDNIVRDLNTLSLEAGVARSSVTQRRNLLAAYNAAVPTSGSVAEKARDSKAFLLGSDNLVKYEFQAIANETANASIARGSASDIDVQRADKGVPKYSDKPEVIRQWLMGQMKKRALMAYEAEERVNYAMSRKGSMAGFAEHWSKKTATEDQVKAIWAAQGVPPTGQYMKTEVEFEN